MQPSFNLIDQPWIGAIDSTGQRREYSLRELLLQAHELRTLYDDSPLVIASQLRMILALLYSAYKGPESRSQWLVLWQNEKFDSAMLERYFSRWHSRFDLYSESHPFYQTVAQIGGLNPVTALIPEAASGNNATLFDHQTEENFRTFTANKIASAILVSQYFSLGGGQSGIPGKNFTDSTLTRGAVFVVEGKNLFQTLLFNLVPFQIQPLYDVLGGAGEPAWEKENPLNPERSAPAGLLDYMTWQSRRIKLMPKASGEVSDIYRSQGLTLNKELGLLDPMKSYKRYADSLGLVSLQPDRVTWRDAEALFKIRDSGFRPPAVVEWLGILVERKIFSEAETLKYLVLGMAAGQAKVDYYRSESMPLPLDYLDEQKQLITSLSTILRASEKVASSLASASFFTSWLMLEPNVDQNGEVSLEKITSKMSAALKESRFELNDKTRDEVGTKIATLYLSWGTERRYWSLLEPLFRHTMQAIPQDTAAAMTSWFDLLRKVAWVAFDQVCDGLGNSPRALKAVVRGREHLTIGLSKVLKIDA